MKPSNESDRGELEPDAPRGARPVLRGRGAGDNTPLPGKKQKQVDPLYTVARYTTTQAAEMLGIKRVTVYSAIQRGNLETELASPGTHLISQAAIDAYRAHHLGQVGQPTRKKQKMMMKMAEARQPAAADRSSAAASRTADTPDGDVEGAG